MNKFDVSTFRQHFPLLSNTVNDLPLVYFDNGATTQKPNVVIDTEAEVYQQYNANVHRASHALSAKATLAFEQARAKVQHFIQAKYLEEIIWTPGTTGGINLIAQSWGQKNLQAGDEILLSHAEHHANIVPWQMIAEKTGAIIKVLPLDASGRIDENSLVDYFNEKTKVVSFTHISNVIGKVNPVKKIITLAKKFKAITVIDGAQACAHLALNMQTLDCDFYVFSAHKMFGPTGVGVLYGRRDLLTAMPPYQGGGEMIKKVSFQGTSFNQLPFKFEAGTPNYAGVIAFSASIEFINSFGVAQLAKYESLLTSYCYEKLSQIKAVKFVVEDKPDISVVSFTVFGAHNYDIASGLDAYGIAIRSGHHCAMPLMDYLKLSGCIRVSLAAYNTYAEIDFFIEKLNLLIQGTDDNVDKIIIEPYHLAQPVNSTNHSAMIVRFSLLKGWDSRHREIMMLGKSLVRMDKSFRNNTNLIVGCESHAWLMATKNTQDEFIFSCDSDAKVIRGLMVIILAAFQQLSSAQILAFDDQSYFSKLGLLQHLSPSRSNGVKAIVEKIKMMARQHQS
ncbi:MULTISPECIES: SufS family cysteine desulfurase [unclassified Colwellia]|uniref:SufS family cysteine desulfurase n=1 Tax=unclassified Colwellia TaxID=196834 RepID=UPI0015F641F6|nr:MULTISPECIES: SufS family cysteine desulfurase [unclassified Colwellia]MBA6355883.1 SufS family cysteine desulfurase [Colwellia sp. BRX8-3]MBA6359514.1 SufS family cysteine desulfurase [Colwellia sp. BRX8-6]MBA6367395.1 SufS family cysteine desulfurase [Colwellia sp. BRX8-5]MBA6373846.1 SufS family cysteine desulfurase [Colwellia sp. BRX8-2]